MSKQDKDYSYINHKDNFPLQLNGHMLKKVQKQEKNIPKWQQFMNKQPTFDILKNKKCQQKAKNIISNYDNIKALPNNFNTPQKVNSIKIVNRQVNTSCSGVSYLINKSGQNQVQHLQRRHLDQRRTFKKDIDEKKHYYNKKNMQTLSQENENFEYTFNKKGQTKNEPVKQQIKTKMNEVFGKINIENNNKKYEVKKKQQQNHPHNFVVQISPGKRSRVQKIRQLIGNGLDQQRITKKDRRDDFRKSSIVFG